MVVSRFAKAWGADSSVLSVVHISPVVTRRLRAEDFQVS